jgi:hypothetical protein
MPSFSAATAIARNNIPVEICQTMPLYISNRLVKTFLNDDLILWINPAKVHYHIGTSRPENRKIKQLFAKLPTKNLAVRSAQRITLRATNFFESFAIESAFYQDLTQFEQHRKYLRVRDFIQNRENFRESRWYKDLVADLEAEGAARHKTNVMTSIQDIEHFMQYYVLSMIKSLERDGFDFRKGGGIGRALISENGTIHKSSSGRHRFYVARELGISPIPLRIAGVHEDWYRKHIGKRFRPGKLRMALSEVQANHS